MIYGNIIGSYAFELILWNDNYTENFSISANLMNASFNNINFYKISVRSGVQDSSLIFVLLDCYGQIVKEESESSLYFKPNTFNFTATFYTIPLSLIPSQGLYNLTLGSQIIYMPNSTINITPITSALPNNTNLSLKQTIVNINFNICQLGEIYQNNTCSVCPNGYYILSLDQFYNGSCIPCNQNAICTSGSIIDPLPGFWRKNTTSDLIIECKNPDACPGFTSDNLSANLSGECSQGYENNLCGICSISYGKFDNAGSCYSCNENPFYYLMLILSLLSKILLVTSSILCGLKLSGDIENKHLAKRKAILMKILINFSQSILFIRSFHLQWTGDGLHEVNVVSKVTFSSGSIMSIDCLLSNLSITSPINKFYIEALISLIIPNILVISCFIAIVVSCIETRYRWLSSKKDLSKCLFLVFFIYFQQIVLTTSFSFFDCRNFYRSDTPEFYLFAAPDIQCWTLDHFQWCFYMAVPMIILWGAIIPSVLAHKIRKEKNPEIIQKELAFMVVGYKNDFPNISWEAFYMLRRLLLVMNNTLTPLISTGLSLLISLGIAFFSFVLQFIYNPFEDEIANYIEKLSILSILLSYFIGIYFYFESIMLFDLICFFIFLVNLGWFIVTWIMNYLRIIAVSNGGLIEKLLIGILKNPENLKKEIKRSFPFIQIDETSVSEEKVNGSQDFSSLMQVTAY